MAPAEVNVSSLRHSKMPQHAELNEDMLLNALDEPEERRDQARPNPNYQHQIESYYNRRRNRTLKTRARWEGPYTIVKIVKPGVYRLQTSSGEDVPRAWNSMHLRRYYS
ncbi:hypothetical protein Bca4012_019305 [Brassica carinata]